MDQAPTSAAQDTASALVDHLGPFRRYLDSKHRSKMTVKTYTMAVTAFDRYLAETGMPRKPASIRREHVEAFIVDQLQRNRAGTAASRYRSLQQFFRFLVVDDEIDKSPMASMSPPTVEQAPPPVLREADKEALLRATAGTSFDDRRDRAIIRLLMDTGMRRSELAGVRLEDLDLDQKLVYLRDAKNKRPRWAPYDREAARELDRYLRVRRAHPQADSPWLWLGKRGRLTDTGVAQMIKRRGEEAGIEGLHPHLFRHTAAHELLADGMQEGDLMRVMGWRSPLMPKRYGASAAHERAVEAYRRIKDGQR